MFGEIIDGINIFESINVHGRFNRFNITHNSNHSFVLHFLGVRGMADTDGGGEPIDSICIYSCGKM